jgi:hypothetical protein
MRTWGRRSGRQFFTIQHDDFRIFLDMIFFFFGKASTMMHEIPERASNPEYMKHDYA